MKDPICFKEVTGAINKLHLRKATGVDNIKSENARHRGATSVRTV